MYITARIAFIDQNVASRMMLVAIVNCIASSNFPFPKTQKNRKNEVTRVELEPSEKEHVTSRNISKQSVGLQL